MLNKLLAMSVLMMSLLFVSEDIYSIQIFHVQQVRDDSGNYQVNFPTDWKVKSGKELGVDVIAEVPNSGKEGKFNTNAIILKEALPAEMSAKEYFDGGKGELEKFDGFKLYQVKEVILNDQKGIEAEYSYKYQDTQVHALQVVVVKGKLAIVITFGTIEENFASSKALFQDIAKTLLVK